MAVIYAREFLLEKRDEMAAYCDKLMDMGADPDLVDVLKESATHCLGLKHILPKKLRKKQFVYGEIYQTVVNEKMFLEITGIKVNYIEGFDQSSNAQLMKYEKVICFADSLQELWGNVK